MERYNSEGSETMQLVFSLSLCMNCLLRLTTRADPFRPYIRKAYFQPTPPEMTNLNEAKPKTLETYHHYSSESSR